MTVLYLCCAKSLDSQVKELVRAGKKGRLAAINCVKILGTFRRKGLADRIFINKRTKCGEARVENCIKYDLGHGYRMITIRNKNQLFIPFVGTHDKADLWLENNRLQDFSKNTSSYILEKIFYQKNGCDSGEVSAQSFVRDEYEESLLNKIDEKTLRHIFRGLIDRQHTSPSLSN